MSDNRFSGLDFDVYVARYYTNKVKNSRSEGHEFHLSLTQVKNMLRAKRCQLSGVELTHGAGGEGTKSPVRRFTDVTIDRIDNTKPYVSGNVMAVCYGVNTFKGVLENNETPLTFQHVNKMCKKLSKLKII